MASCLFRLNGAAPSAVGQSRIRQNHAANGVTPAPHATRPARPAGLLPQRAQPSELAVEFSSPSSTPETPALFFVAAADHHAVPGAVDHCSATNAEHNTLPKHDPASANPSSGADVPSRSSAGGNQRDTAAGSSRRRRSSGRLPTAPSDPAAATTLYQQIAAEVTAADTAAIKEAFAGANDDDGVPRSGSGVGLSGVRRRKRTDGAASKRTASPNADATVSHNAASDGDGGDLGGSRGGAAVAALNDGNTAAATAAGSSDGSSSGGSAATDSAAAQRSRVADVKLRLLRAMRSARTSPTADSISLVLAPVKPSNQSLEEVAAAAAAGSGGLGLRAEPLPAGPPGRSAQKAPPAGEESALPSRPVGKAKARPAGEESALPSRAVRKSKAPPVGEGPPLHAVAVDEEGKAKLEDQAVAAARKSRVLLPGARRRHAAPDAVLEEATASGGRPGGGGELAVRGAAGDWETRDERPAGRGTPGPSQERLRGVPPLRAAEAEARRRQAEADEQARVKQANEEFARNLERIAAAAAAAGTLTAAGRVDAPDRPTGLRGGSARDGASQTQGKPEQDTNARAGDEYKQAPQPPQRGTSQQADVLQGLADMFRKFARQGPPAAAAAMVAAGATAAATAEPAAQHARDTVPSLNPFSFFGSGRKPNDVKLLLEPMAPEDEQDDVTAGAKRIIRARPLPTRRELLSVLTPAPLPRHLDNGEDGASDSEAAAAAVGEARRRGGLLGRRRGLRLRSIEMDLDGATAAGLRSRPLVLPAVQRLQRRREYFFRVLRARRLAEMDGGTEAAEAERKVAEEAGAASEATPPTGQAAAAAPAEVQERWARRRYSVHDRSFKVSRKLQYTDRVKHIVRRAGLASRAVATADTIVGGAATTAAGAGTSGQPGAAVAQAGVVVAEEDPEDARGEYNPAAEVLNDVYEQIMGVRLPERAMYGQRAEVLAAMAPKTVKEQCKAWVEACGQEYALAFHAKEPRLLAQSPRSLLLTLEHLATHLGLPPDACVKLVLRSPALVGLRVEQLSGTVEAVSETLEVGLQEAAAIVAKAPVLALRQPVLPVSQRVALLAALLPVSRDKLRQVLRSRPELLSKSIMNLASFMTALSGSLGLPLFDVALMIAGCPNITGVNAARIASRLSLLRAAVSRHPAWQQQLEEMAPPSLARCLVASEAALGRLQTIVDRGLTGHVQFDSFKDVLTMPSGRFEALAARGPRQVEAETQQKRLAPRVRARTGREGAHLGVQATEGVANPHEAAAASALPRGADGAVVLGAASGVPPPPPAAVVAVSVRAMAAAA